MALEQFAGPRLDADPQELGWSGAVDLPNVDFDRRDQELLLSAALDLQYDGRISRNNLRAVRDLGIFVTSKGAYWAGGNRGS